ncbi:hypothetical protein B296_00026616 [Ensete ventricosum]|uniref:Uncharacterized protein n=1 Tax=Ensete ventricosum TaxID=4639 RepID=A0A427AJM6_ENSVE|nr:hypothetical protein B296_00026616 [Ensete ventricosum]
MDSAAAEETKKAGDGPPTGEAELEEEQGGVLPAVRAEAGEEESKEEEAQTKGGGHGPTEKVVVEKRKRGRRPKAAKSGDGQEGTPKTERKQRSVAGEGATPVERPSRERKTVERFSEMALPKAPVPKTPSFKQVRKLCFCCGLQGSGDKLKDIPNDIQEPWFAPLLKFPLILPNAVVSFKLSKRKVDENLQALHTVLFGRKSNVRSCYYWSTSLHARFLRRNILQFSGFVWSENEKGKKRRRTKGSSDATSGEASSERGSKKQRTGHKQPAEDENEDNDEGASVDTKEALSDDEDDGNSREENGHDNSEEEDEDGEQEELAATNKRSAAKQTKKTSEPSKAKNKLTLKIKSWTGAHFKMDLMDRKAEVKRIIEDVINSMSDDDDEDGEEDAKEEDDTKEDSDGDGDK